MNYSQGKCDVKVKQNKVEKANVDLHCITKCKTEIKPDKSERLEKQKKSIGFV